MGVKIRAELLQAAQHRRGREVAQRAQLLGLDAADFLARNDAYTFLSQTGGLLITGPTHTNVCDLRVLVVDRCELPARTIAPS